VAKGFSDKTSNNSTNTSPFISVTQSAILSCLRPNFWAHQPKGENENPEKGKRQNKRTGEDAALKSDKFVLLGHFGGCLKTAKKSAVS
jgi:hypothetical protein